MGFYFHDSMFFSRIFRLILTLYYVRNVLQLLWKMLTRIVKISIWSHLWCSFAWQCNLNSFREIFHPNIPRNLWSFYTILQKKHHDINCIITMVVGFRKRNKNNLLWIVVYTDNTEAFQWIMDFYLVSMGI